MLSTSTRKEFSKKISNRNKSKSFQVLPKRKFLKAEYCGYKWVYTWKSNLDAKNSKKTGNKLL